MITNMMMKLVRHFDAWFITRNDIREDLETVIQYYHIFTESDILVVYINENLDYEKSLEELVSRAEKANDLECWYDRFLVAANKLDTEDRQQLIDILEPIKPAYDKLCARLYPHLIQDN